MPFRDESNQFNVSTNLTGLCRPTDPLVVVQIIWIREIAHKQGTMHTKVRLTLRSTPRDNIFVHMVPSLINESKRPNINKLGVFFFFF